MCQHNLPCSIVYAHCLLPGRAFASLYVLLFLEKEAEIGGRDDWNLNFSRMNPSLECMIFFIRISRNYVVSIQSVFLFLVLSVCWLQYLIVTNRGPSIIIYANRKNTLAQYILEVYDTCELDLVKKSISVSCLCTRLFNNSLHFIPI